MHLKYGNSTHHPNLSSRVSGLFNNFVTCYSRNVFLRLVELLLEVTGRGLAGDFDHGQLFVVAGHVARRPAHAVAALHSRQFSFTPEGAMERGEAVECNEMWKDDDDEQKEKC